MSEEEQKQWRIREARTAKRGFILYELKIRKISMLTWFLEYRADDKTAEEYALEGGATLHLVLALRGGAN